MGAHRRLYTVGTEQDFRVVNIISHSSYQKPIGLSYDFALIKLQKPAILNKAVGLVCVPDGSTPAMPIDNLRKKCWITGWGTLASGGASPDILQQASVPLVSKNRYNYLISISLQKPSVLSSALSTSIAFKCFRLQTELNGDDARGDVSLSAPSYVTISRVMFPMY